MNTRALTKLHVFIKEHTFWKWNIISLSFIYMYT